MPVTGEKPKTGQDPSPLKDDSQPISKPTSAADGGIPPKYRRLAWRAAWVSARLPEGISSRVPPKCGGMGMTAPVRSTSPETGMGRT